MASLKRFATLGGVTAVEADPNFNLTTLLLHGDGTNGAQNNTFLDSSTNNFTITRNGNTTQGTFSPFSQTGWSNNLTGSATSLRMAANAAFDQNAGSFSVECWVYPSTIAAGGLYIYGPQSNAALLMLAYGYTTGLFKIDQGGGGGGIRITSSNTYAANTWHHVAYTYDGTTLKLFVNGNLQGTATGLSTIASPAVGIGEFGASSYFNGYVSNLRICRAAIPTAYQTASTTVGAQIFTPATTPLTTTSQGASNVSFLTCQSNRFIDNSTNALAITANGSPSVQAFSPFAPTSAYDSSVVGGSGYFDGTGDYLVTPSSTEFDIPSGGQWCLDFWMYSSVSGFKAVFNKNWGFGGPGPTQGFYLSGSTAFYSDGGSGTAIVTASIAPPLLQWNHYVYTKDSTNTIRIFVNGVLAGSAVRNTVIGTFPVFIGIASNLAAGSTSAGYYGDLRFVNGSIPTTYQTISTTNGTTIFSVPTTPTTTTSEGATSGDVKLLLNYTNAGIIDNTAKNNLETVGNAQISTSVKQFGTGSLAFDGTGDWLTFIDRPTTRLGSGNFTIEGWVYINTAGVAYGLISKGTATTGWSVNITSGDKLQFSYTSSNLTGATSLSANTWYYFAVVRSGTATGNLKLYLDGSVDATSGTAVTDNFNQTNIGYIGASRTATTPLNGYLDDVRITLAARTITTPTGPFPDQ